MLRKFQTLALSGLLFTMAAWPVMPNGAACAQMLDTAKEFLKKGQTAKAVDNLNSVLAKDPGNSEGHLLLGQSYLKAHNYAKARQQLRAAIRTGRGSPNAQKANALLLTLPKQFLSPKTGAQTRMIASMLGLTATRGGEAKPTIIDFYAPWCVPCKQLNGVIDKMKTQYGDKVNFLTVNVDDPDNGKLIDQYDVSPIPTLVFLNPEGEVVSFSIGYSGDNAVSNNLKKILVQPG